MLKKIMIKLFCNHEWFELTCTNYTDCDIHLYTCKKCGKMKKVRL